MTSDRTWLHRQIRLLTEGSSACSEHRNRILQLQQALSTADSELNQRTQELTEQSQKRLAAETAAVDAQHAERQGLLRSQLATELAGLDRTTDASLQEARQSAEDQLHELSEKRKNDAWLLESMLDEQSTDGPKAEHQRESDAFERECESHRHALIVMDDQLASTAAYLGECHAAVGNDLPPAVVSEKTRESLIGLIDESGTQLSRSAAAAEKWWVPSLVRGARLWLLPLLLIPAIAIPVTAVRADLRDFISPEIRRPDWGWFGLACLIAVVSVGMISVSILLMVQQRLRSFYAEMLQARSNAGRASADWQKRSRARLKKLEERAAEWEEQLIAERSAREQRLRNESDQTERQIRSKLSEQTRTLETARQQRRQSLTAEVTAALQEAEAAAEAARSELRERWAADRETAVEDARTQHLADRAAVFSEADTLLQQWNERIGELKTLAAESRELAAGQTRWPDPEQLQLPEGMPSGLGIGDLLLTVPQPPRDVTSASESELCIEMPATLQFPSDMAVSVEHNAESREVAGSFLRMLLLRFITSIPAGRFRLSLIDPVGLGRSFAAMMHLADFDELLIHSRIRTDEAQIRDQLAAVTQHMENVFQTYLRSEFDTIEDYNRHAGEVAEPYHLVVIAGFPAAFSEDAARHLTSILSSGPKCGVYPILAWNPELPVPPSFDRTSVTSATQQFRAVDGRILPVPLPEAGLLFESSEEPDSAGSVALVRAVGELSRNARRVEVSFGRISPPSAEIWTRSTRDGIDLPIGRAGAARLQYFRLGRGTSQHVLIAGKTGSGKSTLLHILITNLALTYSPDELQFFLIDFKKGVEFRSYAANRLPHARVIAIESDREFGLSVLERLDELLKERGDLFRERGVQDVPAFRNEFPEEPMPRLVLLIDEFQEFFVSEDRVSARASLLLDRLIRQGRAFGIHVVLGSQTLGGAYSLARSTMGQVAVRIALQCSENDAHLILSEDNSAARLLTRPGEAIYNDANGMSEGNHHFQIAWLSEDEREERIREMRSRQPNSTDNSGLIVFEGTVAPSASHCGPLIAALKGNNDSTRRDYDSVSLWLGEPLAIAAPARADLSRSSGQNLLIVGQDEPQAAATLAMCIISAAMSRAPQAGKGARVLLAVDRRDQTAADRFQLLARAADPNRFTIFTESELSDRLQRLTAELEARESGAADSSDEPVLLIIRNIGQFRELRKADDDFGLGSFGADKPVTPASQLEELIRRGPLVGIHCIVWADTFSNCMRFLSTSLLREFENRIAFRMNQTDSAGLIDNPSAASLVSGRAVLYRDQTGQADKYRPFGWPEQDWLEFGLRELRTDEPDINSLIIE